MDAELVLAPLGGSTHIEFRGVYRPPLGAVGLLLDRVALHRLAEATVRNFLKRVRGAELLESIRRVAAGGSLLDPEMTETLFRRLRGDGSEDPLLSRLSPQEQTILGHIAEGKTNKQIADEMFLAEKTVKNYVSNMLAKLGMARRTEAAAYMARATADEERYPPEEWPEGAPSA